MTVQKFDEDVRLQALDRTHLMHSPREQQYDDIVALVQSILNVPIALVSLVHRDVQWFKACIGLSVDSTARDVSFCSYAIDREDLAEPFIIEDATQDDRFKNNPLVTGSPNVRMYVGVPILTRGGQAIGSLCAIDTQPRRLTQMQIAALKTLARNVSTMIALRETNADLEESEERGRLVLNHSHDAIITLNVKGEVTTWNAAAKQLFGLPASQAFGRPFAKLGFAPDTEYGVVDRFVERLNRHECYGMIHTELAVCQRSDGRSFNAEMNTVRLGARGGDLFSIFLRDRTEHEEKLLLERDAELREVTIFAMAKLAESRDPETGAHIERVQHYCKALAETLAREGPYQAQADPEWVHLMYTTSPLHDIGKVGIPDSILLKAGRLSDREFEVMKLHAQIGADTLSAAMAKFPNTRFLKLAQNIAATHHERFDGTGYPRGLRGLEIPICGRVMALADVYDALTSRRVYKAAMAHEVARGIIVKDAGSHFDPAIVDAFLRCEARFEEIRREFGEWISEAA